MADLCQTAGWGHCSDHSGSVAPLVQAIETKLGGLSDSFSLAHQTVPVCTDHGLTGTSTFFYKWPPNKLVKKSISCVLKTRDVQLTRILPPSLQWETNEEDSSATCQGTSPYWQFIVVQFLIDPIFFLHPNVGVGLRSRYC